jgi:CheY-like chemotaxis protein
MSEQVDVLLVDDRQADARLTLHAIDHAHLPHRFRVLRDGEEALRYLLSTVAPLLKLILLDLKLPKVRTGSPEGSEIRSDLETRSRCGAHLFRAGERYAHELPAGANSYIQKPVDFDAFRELVQQVRVYWLGLNKVPTRN